MALLPPVLFRRVDDRHNFLIEPAPCPVNPAPIRPRRECPQLPQHRSVGSSACICTSPATPIFRPRSLRIPPIRCGLMVRTSPSRARPGRGASIWPAITSASSTCTPASGSCWPRTPMSQPPCRAWHRRSAARVMSQSTTAPASTGRTPRGRGSTAAASSRRSCRSRCLARRPSTSTRTVPASRRSSAAPTRRLRSPQTLRPSLPATSRGPSAAASTSRRWTPAPACRRSRPRTTRRSPAARTSPSAPTARRPARGTFRPPHPRSPAPARSQARPTSLRPTCPR